MSAAASAAISGTMLESGDEGITDNESNFESASYYLGRNLAADDMAEIDAAAIQDEDDVNEIPVWVRGETRWIAGVTEYTTAADLVEALLIDDRSLVNPATSSLTPADAEPSTAVLQQFVITERWRQMEQILEPKTKVWKIWKAWGEAQCEVRLRLRKIDRNGPPQSTTTSQAVGVTSMKRANNNNSHHHEEDGGGQVVHDDSGRESPTGSAIVRRRRHRASKSTAAWLTQAQTVHPKSSKSTIEKLMSLILEQGETIQHQLSKLRDREIQISQLEEQKHKIREQEHGKNYLLETYLNGLHEAEEKDLTTINSDSGVNTEDTQSPNGGTSPMVLESEDKIIPSISGTKKSNFPNMFEYTERENELLQDHENAKSLKLKLIPEEKRPSKATGTINTKDKDQKGRHRQREEASTRDDENELQELEDKIEVLEKIYVINKHLQKEEELLVRLNAKIKRYESENPNLREDEILDTLNRLNSEIEQRNREIEITNREIELSDDLLNKKSALLNELGAELGTELDDEAALMMIGESTHKPPPPMPCNDSGFGNGQFMQEGNCFDVNPENIYNISKILLKYSDDGGGAPDTDRDRQNDRINIAACHQPTINKTDTNKRIIMGDGRATEMTLLSPVAGSHNRHTVTTRVQIHKQPAMGQLNPDGFVEIASQPTGNHYLCSDAATVQMRLSNSGSSSVVVGSASPLITTAGVDATVPNNVTDFTPVDLIATSTMLPKRRDIDHDERLPVPPPGHQPTLMMGHRASPNGMHFMKSSLAKACVGPVPGISDKVTPINPARNISATLMDNKKLAHKNFILTSKAYEGLSPVVGVKLPQPPQPRCSQTSTDVTQLGTLV